MERMAYFLFKTEPDVYSFDHFLRDQETKWDGVTNPTAVMHLRQMKAGTKWIFYHTAMSARRWDGDCGERGPHRSQGANCEGQGGQAPQAPQELMAIKSEPLFEGSRCDHWPAVRGALTREQWDWLVA